MYLCQHIVISDILSEKIDNEIVLKKTGYNAPTILFHQVKELVGWVNNSNADFVVLGGDFNTSPTDDVVHHFRV